MSEAESTPVEAKEEAPMIRYAPLSVIEGIGLHHIASEIARLQALMREGYQAIAVKAGQEPANREYRVSADGQSIELHD